MGGMVGSCCGLRFINTECIGGRVNQELMQTFVQCPYCGESIEVLVEPMDESDEYIEDCQVCCRPIVFNVITDMDGEQTVSVHSENEVD